MERFQKKKMIRHGILIWALFLGMLMLGGCDGDFPNLDDEQIEMAGEYAAMMLLRYDSLNRSRLMSVEDMNREEQRRAAWKEAAREVKKEDQEKQEEQEREEGNQDNKNEDGNGKENVWADNLNDMFSLGDGVTIEFLGYEVYNRYPKESNSLSITANAGKKLIVLKFQIRNDNDGSMNVDLFAQNNTYVVTVNGKYSGKSMDTLLMNDLSTYQGKLMPSDKEELVLLVEADEDIAIETIRLKLKNDRIESTISLYP